MENHCPAQLARRHHFGEVEAPNLDDFTLGKSDINAYQLASGFTLIFIRSCIFMFIVLLTKLTVKPCTLSTEFSGSNVEGGWYIPLMYRYIYCLLGGYIIPTTYYQNQNHPLTLPLPPRNYDCFSDNIPFRPLVRAKRHFSERLG